MKPTKHDFKTIAEQTASTLGDRKRKRKDSGLEDAWNEVDRQVAMIPTTSNYRQDWVPEFELPLQANALEVLCADADRMQFPDSHEWFSAVGAMTDDLLDRMSEDLKISGINDDELGSVKTFDQENINSIIEAAVINVNKQYPLRDHINLLNAEAFKYGTYAARIRMVEVNTFTNTFRGITKDNQQIPVMVPSPIRSTYLDDTPIQAMYQGHILRPLHICTSKQKVADLKHAASKGSGDTTSMSGGWLKSEVSRMESPDKNDEYIDIIEAEGDFIIPRKTTGDGFFPNLIVTIAEDIFGPRVIRIRENSMPFNSLIYGTYYRDKIGVYGISPLMKGAPLQTVATELLTNLTEVSVLNARPPVAYNSNDPKFQATGGPEIEPNALWDTFTNPDIVKIGDLNDTVTAYAAVVKQYEDVVGVNSIRSGGQTKSHQTAYAVDKEASRGQSRTVAYVRGQARGFITDVLNMKLFLLRQNMPRQDIFVPKYAGYVKFGKESLPDTAHFTVTGAAGPLEKREAANTKITALVSVLKMEPTVRQLDPKAKKLNIDRVREDVLKEGMPDQDVQGYFDHEAPEQQMPPGAGMNAGAVQTAGPLSSLEGGPI